MCTRLPQFLLQKLPGDKVSKYSNMYLYAYVHKFLLQAMLTYIQHFFSKETNNNEGKFRKIHVFIKIKYGWLSDKEGRRKSER